MDICIPLCQRVNVYIPLGQRVYGYIPLGQRVNGYIPLRQRVNRYTYTVSLCQRVNGYTYISVSTRQWIYIYTSASSISIFDLHTFLPSYCPFNGQHICIPLLLTIFDRVKNATIKNKRRQFF